MSHDDDKELNDFLDGQTKLSKIYHQADAEGPSKALDAKILAQAQKAVQHSDNTDTVNRRDPRRPQWLVPVSLAATVVLGLGLSFNLKDFRNEVVYSDNPMVVTENADLNRRNQQFEKLKKTDQADQIKAQSTLDASEERLDTQTNEMREVYGMTSEQQPSPPLRKSEDDHDETNHDKNRQAFANSRTRQLEDSQVAARPSVAGLSKPDNDEAFAPAPVTIASEREAQPQAKPAEQDSYSRRSEPLAEHKEAALREPAQNRASSDDVANAPLASQTAEIQDKDFQDAAKSIDLSRGDFANLDDIEQGDEKDKAMVAALAVAKENKEMTAMAGARTDSFNDTRYVCDLSKLGISTRDISRATAVAMNANPQKTAPDWLAEMKKRVENRKFREACRQLAAFNILYPDVIIPRDFPIILLP